MDRQLIRLIEKVGYINRYDQRVYGAAALLHFAHVMNSSNKELDSDMIDRGKAILKKCLCA